MTLPLVLGIQLKMEQAWSPTHVSEPRENGETDMNQVHKESSRITGNPVSALKEIKKRVKREEGGTEEPSWTQGSGKASEEVMSEQRFESTEVARYVKN